MFLRKHASFVLLSLFLSPLNFSAVAQTSSAPESLSRDDARAELVRRGFVFDRSTPDKEEETVFAFTDAAWFGRLEDVRLYLAAGVPLNARNKKYGNTALYAAAENERWKTAQFLLERGADPNLANKTGRTPLLSAVQHGIEDGAASYDSQAEALIRALLARGANVNARTNDGQNVFMRAVNNGDAGLNVTRQLLPTADLNATDEAGRTALMHALRSANNKETLVLLLANGAQVNVKDVDGDNAIAYAGSADEIKLLLENGAQLSSRQRLQYYGYKFARYQTWILIAAFALCLIIGRLSASLIKVPEKRDAASHGDKLPNLVPLKCDNCGAGVPLREAKDARCPGCEALIAIPHDYVNTLKLRAEAAAQLQQAVRKCRHARITTSLPVIIFFSLIAVLWIAAVIYGLFNRLGTELISISAWSLLFALLNLLNGISLAAFFVVLVVSIGGMRKRLPKIPRIGKHIGAPQVANCHLCGSPIAYAKGELVAACRYCGGETYRVALARRARVVAEAEKTKVEISLYDTMVEITRLRKEMLENLGASVVIVYYLAIRLGFEVATS